MRTPRLRYLSWSLLAASAAFLYLQLSAAPAPSLADRIARLRAEISTQPTNTANYAERMETLVDWGNDLALRGRLPAVQDLILAASQHHAYRAADSAIVNRWARILEFAEDKFDHAGQLTRTDERVVSAGQYSSMTLEYTVGDVEIPTGGAVRIGTVGLAAAELNTAGSHLQWNQPAQEGFVSFKSVSNSAKIEPFGSQAQGVFASFIMPAPVPAAKVVSGSLKKGDHLIITLGDTSAGGPGFKPKRDADDFRCLLEIDPSGSGTFFRAASTSTRILGGKPAAISAVAPSMTAVNERFAVRLRVEDDNLNPALFAGGRFLVSLDGRKLGEIPVLSGQSAGRLEGVRISREGAYKVSVTSADGRLKCLSNPILVEKQPRQRIYWGELHGHSGWEEGTGSVPHYYAYARDFAYLDFGSLTGHDAFLPQAGWNEIRKETAAANRPGSFVAFMGYEWSQNFRTGGHHNVFFKNDNGRYARIQEAPTPPELYARLRATEGLDNVLIIPHAHTPGDWNFNDPEMQKLVEIYSGHGSFEYFGQRFLRRGYRVGLVGASDDHSGHPGYSQQLVATRNGLAAVYSPALDREGIWRALKDRATYATSNAQRLVLKMTVGDGQPGSSIPVGTIPQIQARVLGTAAIEHIDLIHNSKVEYSQDYATPQPGDATAVQVMFHSLTETPGDAVTPPQPSATWDGSIEVSGGTIQSIDRLGIDGPFDQFEQTDNRHVKFSFLTRGDFDGVLLRLGSAPADTRVTVRLDHLGGVVAGNAPVQKEVSFGMDEIAGKRTVFDVATYASVLARRVKPDAPWDVSFRYRPTTPPEKNDYYYLRVVQIDGETAWGSPVWVGPEPASSVGR